MKRYPWPLAAVAVVAAGVSYPRDPDGTAPTAPIVWTSPHPYAPTWTEEASEPSGTAGLFAAGVYWSHNPPLEDVRRFAATVAGEAPNRLTGLVMMSIGAFESNFAADVGSGARRGDHGAACGYMQIHLDIQKRPGDPSCAAAVLDLREYVHAALRWLRDTPTAWGNIGWHRARATAWAASHP